jgi:hypothetical protein
MTGIEKVEAEQKQKVYNFVSNYIFKNSDKLMMRIGHLSNPLQRDIALLSDFYEYLKINEL